MDSCTKKLTIAISGAARKRIVVGAPRNKAKWPLFLSESDMDGLATAMHGQDGDGDGDEDGDGDGDGDAYPPTTRQYV